MNNSDKRYKIDRWVEVMHTDVGWRFSIVTSRQESVPRVTLYASCEEAVAAAHRIAPLLEVRVLAR